MTPKAPLVNRIAGLDFTKGVLVLLMVVYHWMNYTFPGEDYAYRYLRFLTPSFIFITGFLISHVYISKQNSGKPGGRARLLVRGLKLLAMFVVLNVPMSLIPSLSQKSRPLFQQISAGTFFEVYILGNGRLAAFSILIPISYLLFLSAFLLDIRRRYVYVAHLSVVLCGLGIIVLDRLGVASPNAELLTMGLLGIVSGAFPIWKIEQLKRFWPVLILAYGGYVVAITLWNVIYPLQIVGVYLTLCIIFLHGTGTDRLTGYRQTMILLGKYSLLGYIAQIAILQVIRIGMRVVEVGPVGKWMVLLLAAAMTIVTVIAVDRGRSRGPVFNRLYVSVFG